MWALCSVTNILGQLCYLLSNKSQLNERSQFLSHMRSLFVKSVLKVSAVPNAELFKTTHHKSLDNVAVAKSCFNIKSIEGSNFWSITLYILELICGTELYSAHRLFSLNLTIYHTIRCQTAINFFSIHYLSLLYWTALLGTGCLRVTFEM